MSYAMETLHKLLHNGLKPLENTLMVLTKTFNWLQALKTRLCDHDNDFDILDQVLLKHT